MDNTESTNYGVEEEVASTQKKVADFVKKNLYEIAVIAVCLVRVVVGIAPVQLSGKSVIEIIGDSMLTIIFAILLARLLEEKGLAVGEKANDYVEAMKAYRLVEARAGRYIGKMDEWCERYSKEAYKKTITSMLYPLGITYEQYMQGDYDENRFTKGQLHQLHKIRHTKMYVYTTEELMSGSLDRASDARCMKASKKKYRKRSAVSDLGSKLVLSLVFGMLILPPMSAWNWAGVIWKLFETVVLFAFAVIKYFKAYNYVNEDLCAKVTFETTILSRFLEEVENSGEENASREKEIKGEKEYGNVELGRFGE